MSDFERVEAAIQYISENYRDQPGLNEIAASVNLSPFHFQRLFKRWAGITPKRFVQFLTLEYAKRLLEESQNVLDVSYEVGLSGPGRLHDLFVSLEAMTPGEFKDGGRGLQVGYAFCDSPFGECLVALTDRGVCHLSFVKQQDRQARLLKLQRNWPQAQLREAPESVAAVVPGLFAFVRDRSGERIRLFVRGTNFQISVWKALLQIPPGCLISYEKLAQRVGRPRSVRAVANAVGANPVSYLIPCHRVIRKAGQLGGYDGGLDRKRALIAWEAARWRRLESAL